MTTDRSNAMDHVVVALFENRSLDNVLGHLYEPGDGKTFEGVTGKDLSNPIPDWAEEHSHTNTQLYNILSKENRPELGAEITAPYNAPEPGQTPTMDGYVTDYISRTGRRRAARSSGASSRC